MQQTFSNEHTPTVWRIITSLEFLIKWWETMADQSRYPEVKDTIYKGTTSFKKWYQKVDDTSAAYFICLSESLAFPGLCQLVISSLICISSPQS